MKFLRGIIIGLCCVLSLNGISQNGFTTYTTNLSLNGTKLHTALLVDNSSNKWIGFRSLGTTGVLAGLVKYDNVIWTIFSTVTTPSLVSNYVTSLAKDNSGNLWIGTDSGLVKYDGSAFTNYSLAQGLPSKFVRCVEVIGNDVFVGTNKGLSYFDGTNFTNYNVANGKLSNDTVACIKAESANLLWLGNRNNMVEFNFINAAITNFADHPIGDNPGIINCIYIDQQNTKWLGTDNKGILRYNGLAFENAGLLYSTYGSLIPTTVKDISEGLNQGIIFRQKSLTGTNVYNGLMELAPGNKVYQYFQPLPITSFIGNYVEKDGNTIITSAGFSSGFYSPPKMYMSFQCSGYHHPFGIVNTDNYKSLDINAVDAGVGNRSYMHGLNEYPNFAYEVPKFSGKHVANQSALWIGGKDHSGQLHGGMKRYEQNGQDNDYWPGPLDTISGTIDTLTSIAYDKIWKVSYDDINTFITAFNSGSVVATPDMLSWPAHGTGNNSRNLAPFIDSNHDGNYNPYDGDYPKIKGDQTLYYIYNDMLSSHSLSLAPMGIEVHAMAYAYGCPAILNGKKELAYTTFYNYKIINRSVNNYTDVYAGLWSDARIGVELDDYLGCNVAGNFAYVYNSDTLDKDPYNQQQIYGSYPPAHGTVVLKGPVANLNDGVDNNNDQVIDEMNEDCKMSKLISYHECNSAFPTGREYPYLSEHFYNFLQGKWRDSTSIICGLPGGAGPWNVPTSWMFPGDRNTGISTDPNNTCGNWVEATAPCSRNYIISSGPFTLSAGQMQEVEYAFVTSFDSSSTTNSNLLSVAKLKTDMQKITAFYNLQSKPSCIQSISVGMDEVLKQNDVVLYPNPSRSIITIQSTIDRAVKIDYEITDVLGRTVIQSQSDSNSFTVNVSDLTTGIYFVCLKINNSLIVKKFVKE